MFALGKGEGVVKEAGLLKGEMDKDCCWMGEYSTQNSLGCSVTWGAPEAMPGLLQRITEHLQGGSEGKGSACSTGDPGSIPGLRRSPGEGNGYPLSILAWRIP